MENCTYNHQFLCKLLGIGANHAIIEGAFKTQEIIQNITELVRYMYDPRKGIILLEEEFKAVKNYIHIHTMRGMNSTITAEKSENGGTGRYIRHLSVLSPIIEDIEEKSNSYEEGMEVKYVLECRESEIVLTRNPGNVRIAAIKPEN